MYLRMVNYSGLIEVPVQQTQKRKSSSAPVLVDTRAFPSHFRRYCVIARAKTTTS